MLVDLKKVSNIIFDFDGVIAETDSARFELLSTILEDYGIKLKNKYEPQDLVGSQTDTFLKNNFDFLSEEDVKSIVEKRRRIYLENLDIFCRPYPQAIETINDLKKAGYTLHLATTNDQHVVEELLKFLGLKKSFKTIFYREKIVNVQTNNKDYGLFINESNLNSELVIVIEDSILGVKAAKNAKLSCIAFDIYNNIELKQYADFIVGSYFELRELFGLEVITPQPLYGRGSQEKKLLP